MVSGQMGAEPLPSRPRLLWGTEWGLIPQLSAVTRGQGGSLGALRWHCADGTTCGPATRGTLGLWFDGSSMTRAPCSACLLDLI